MHDQHRGKSSSRLVVIGSIWIMDNLADRMMPAGEIMQMQR